jgi:hypothetical protein
MGTGAFGRTLLSEFANNSPPSAFVGNTHSGQPHEFSWRPRDGIPMAMAWSATFKFSAEVFPLFSITSNSTV